MRLKGKFNGLVKFVDLDLPGINQFLHDVRVATEPSAHQCRRQRDFVFNDQIRGDAAFDQKLTRRFQF